MRPASQRIILSAVPAPSKLDGKRALVTAGAQGIGLAISRHLLAAGCDVFVHYRSGEDAARALVQEAAKLGRRCGHAAADLTEPRNAAASSPTRWRSWAGP